MINEHKTSKIIPFAAIDKLCDWVEAEVELAAFRDGNIRKLERALKRVDRWLGQVNRDRKTAGKAPYVTAMHHFSEQAK